MLRSQTAHAIHCTDLDGPLHMHDHAATTYGVTCKVWVYCNWKMSIRIIIQNKHVMFVATEVNQVLPDLCLQYSVSTSVITKNLRLEDLWCLELIGIKDPLSVESDD